MTKKLPLTKGRVAIIDAADFEWLDTWKWSFSGRRGFGGELDGYAVRTDVYSKPKAVYMHRQILGANKGDVCDHINGDKLDNRRSNLRLCTTQQNVSNKRRQSNNTSGFKCVNFHAQNKNWCVRMKFEGIQTHMGVFDKKIEAAEAYDFFAILLYGDFARLNFHDKK